MNNSAAVFIHFAYAALTGSLQLVSEYFKASKQGLLACLLLWKTRSAGLEQFCKRHITSGMAAWFFDFTYRLDYNTHYQTSC